jgi:cytochrome c
MPLDRPGTLTHSQVYSLVAFLLHMNGIIGENDVLDAKTLPRIRMPNRDGFVPDTRPDVGKTGRKKAASKTSGS